MSEVILLYDRDCPNVAECRGNLLKAFAAAGKKPLWREVDRSAKETPASLRGYGSPTILVDGTDVGGQKPVSDGASCRLYRDEHGGYAGVPSVERITNSIRAERQDDSSEKAHAGGEGWKRSLTVLPAVGVALLPSITCPACWPGYAAVLSSFGIGFLPSNRYLLPLTGVLLVFYVLSLEWDARKRHQYGPLTLGIVGSLVLVVGRFVFDWNAALYAGAALLVITSIWNAWPVILSNRSGPSAAQGWPACQAAGPSENSPYQPQGT